MGGGASNSSGLVHVADDALERDRPDRLLEEELLDGLTRNGLQRRQKQEKLSEPRWLRRVRLLDVLRQRQLGLVLQRRDGSLISQFPVIIPVRLDGGLEQEDGSKAGELCRVDVHLLKLCDRVLEVFKLAEECDGAGRVVDQGRHFNRKIKLGSAKDKQLPPGLFQKQELVSVGKG